MGRRRVSNQSKSKIPAKSKRIQKNVNKQDCIFSMKKQITGKEIVAEFPMIRGINGKPQLAIPIFRNDRLYTTPGFGLPDEFQPEYSKQQEDMHKFRVNSEIFEIPASKIMQPKPSSRNSYCTICKIRFDDYKEHINQDEHLTRMRQSSYNEFIAEMCESYALQTGRYLNFCQEETGIEVSDRKEFFEKRRHSEFKKQKLYEELKEELARRQKPQHCGDEEIYDVLGQNSVLVFL